MGPIASRRWGPRVLPMIDRRTFLRLGVGSAVALAAPPVFRRDPALAQPVTGLFGHGVASGDPLADRVILWTRVTPSPDATPGSGLGPPVDVTWEVARDAAFADVVASGTARTSAVQDHTVRIDPSGLPAATELWYRFGALGATSPVGRTRTAPSPGASVESLRIGVVSCSHYESGYFSAYRHLAQRDDLDLVLHLGDYIYEGGASVGGAAVEMGRLHDPDHEIVTLADYRRRHALYKADPDLAALHQRYAFVTTIDDHEVTNNSWSDGAENHQPDEGAYDARKAVAMQAYREWMPIRTADGDPATIYRSLAFGDLAELIMLDERSYRSQQVPGLSGDIFVTDPAVADPNRTMLGAPQRAWFEERLAASTAQWKLLGNSVMFAPLVLADDPDVPELSPVVRDLLAEAGVAPPVVLNSDQWDGYRAEQWALRDRFGETGGVVILTGDIHSSWAAEIPADPGTYLLAVGGPTTAVEFVTPAVTSDSFSSVLADIGIPAGDVLATQLPLIATTAGPWFKYLDAERQGFGVFEVTADAAQYDWYHLVDRTDPQSAAIDGPSWRTLAGTNKLEQTSRLGPRGSATAPPAVVPASESSAPGAAVAAAGTDRLPATGAAVPAAVAAGTAAAGLAAAALARRAAVGGVAPRQLDAQQ